MISTALLQIPVGVIVERRRAQSPWLDFVYRPVSVLTGAPETKPWTEIDSTEAATTYYAGEAVIELHRTETSGYLENLSCGAPMLWVVLRRAASGFELRTVTADPAEGEAMTGAGDDIVDTVSMPEAIRQALEAFVMEHHVERAFVKRRRQASGHEAPRQSTESREDGS